MRFSRELIQPARLFEEKLEELTHFIRNDFPDSHRYASLRPAPHTEYAPDLFLLGGKGGKRDIRGQTRHFLRFRLFHKR